MKRYDQARGRVLKIHRFETLGYLNVTSRCVQLGCDARQPSPSLGILSYIERKLQRLLQDDCANRAVLIPTISADNHGS